MRPSYLAALVLLIGAVLAPAHARETIVGVWKPEGEARCWPAYGAIQIEQLALIDHDIDCKFDTVSRQGDVVTWKGTCQAVDERPEPTTVVASLRNRVLTLSGNGRSWGRLVRCEGKAMGDR